MTTYTLDAIDSKGHTTQLKQLTAKTDNGARRQARQYLKAHPNSNSVLRYFRTEDHQHGTIDL